MDPLSDEQLINHVLNGDRSALVLLVERYHSPLLGYLYRLTHGNLALAEDLVQETYIQLMRQNSFQPGRPFKPWVYAIATHLAIDHYRSHASRQILSTDGDDWFEPTDPTPGPEESLVSMDEEDSVVAALDQLGDEYRAALILRFYQGLSLQEISQALQIPLGTVKSRLTVGIQRLRGLLSRLEKGGNR